MTRTALTISLLALACTPAPKDATPKVAAAEPPASVAPSKAEPKSEATPPPDVATEPPAPPVEVAPPVVVEYRESLGGIALGTSFADLKKKLPGGTADLPPLEDTGTPGLFGKTMPPPDQRWLWTYDKNDLNVIVASATDKGPWRVLHVTANGRSKHRTKAGIGVRSTIAQVRAAYPSAVFDREDSALVTLSDREQIEILFDDGRATHVVLAGPPRD